MAVETPISVTIGGANVGSSVISLGTQQDICRVAQTCTIALDPNVAADFNPWDEVAIAINGLGRFKGYVDDALRGRKPAEYIVRGTDVMKRALDNYYAEIGQDEENEDLWWVKPFVVEEELDAGYWIDYWLKYAGIATSGPVETGRTVPAGLEWNFITVSDIILECLGYAGGGWTVIVDGDGVAQISRKERGGASHSLTGTIAFSRSQEDSWRRNRAVVFGDGVVGQTAASRLYARFDTGEDTQAIYGTNWIEQTFKCCGYFKSTPSQGFVEGPDAQSVYGTNWIAQSFPVTTGHFIMGLLLKMRRVGNPGPIGARVRRLIGGEPAGSSLWFGGREGNTLTSGSISRWYKIEMPGVDWPTSYLPPGMYALVILAPFGDADNRIEVSGNWEGGYGEGNAFISPDQGASWSSQSSDVLFNEFGLEPTIGDHFITSAKLKMRRVGKPGTIVVGVRDVIDGEAVGPDLSSGSINGNTITSGLIGRWYEIEFTMEQFIATGREYALVIRAPNGDVNNYVEIYRDETSVLFEEWGLPFPKVAALSSTFIGTQAVADELGQDILDFFNEDLDIKRCLIAGDASIWLGETAEVGDPWAGYSGLGLITSIETTVDDRGFRQLVSLDEKCGFIWGHGLPCPYGQIAFTTAGTLILGDTAPWLICDIPGGITMLNTIAAIKTPSEGAPIETQIETSLDGENWAVQHTNLILAGERLSGIQTGFTEPFVDRRTLVRAKTTQIGDEEAGAYSTVSVGIKIGEVHGDL